MKFNIKNVTYADGKNVAAIGDTIEIVTKGPHNEEIKTRGILVAANGEITEGNGRFVTLAQLFAMPAIDITSAKLVSRSEIPKAEHQEESKPPVDGAGLRLDGPTLVAFVEAGYDPKNYPPKGFAAKQTSDPKEVKIREAMALADKPAQP